MLAIQLFFVHLLIYKCLLHYGQLVVQTCTTIFIYRLRQTRWMGLYRTLQTGPAYSSGLAQSVNKNWNLFMNITYVQWSQDLLCFIWYYHFRLIKLLELFQIAINYYRHLLWAKSEIKYHKYIFYWSIKLAFKAILIILKVLSTYLIKSFAKERFRSLRQNFIK